MKTETKSVAQNSGIWYRVSDIGCRASLCSFLSICFLTSLVYAQISSEQLDPTNSLMPYLTEPLFDIDIPPVYLMQPLKSRTVQQERLQISNVDAVNAATEANQKMPRRGFTVPEKQGDNLERQLWRAGISAYEGEKNTKGKSRLKQIIEQIRSIEFKPPKKTVEPVIIVKPVVKTVEPNNVPSETEAEESVKRKIKFKLPYEPLTDRTLQLVGDLSQHPEKLNNPFTLGEVLYYSGHLKEAAVFYQEALKRKSADKTTSKRDKAWIIFQIGNCLRSYDLPAAKKMYGILITEYSDSLWVDLARAREGLVDWQQKNKPRTLIAESKL